MWLFIDFEVKLRNYKLKFLVFLKDNLQNLHKKAGTTTYFVQATNIVCEYHL